jgi:hypothetical protein
MCRSGMNEQDGVSERPPPMTVFQEPISPRTSQGCAPPGAVAAVMPALALGPRADPTYRTESICFSEDRTLARIRAGTSLCCCASLCTRSMSARRSIEASA